MTSTHASTVWLNLENLASPAKLPTRTPCEKVPDPTAQDGTDQDVSVEDDQRSLLASQGTGYAGSGCVVGQSSSHSPHQRGSTGMEFASLQGLAQAFFQFYAIGSADAWTVAVLQNEFELAVRNGLKLKDTVYVNDGRSMNADESHGIEMAS